MSKKRSQRIKALVLLCSCKGSIGKVVDFDRLESTLKKYPEVVGVIRHDVLCGNDGNKFLLEQVKATGADRVVVAGCTPRTHENILEHIRTDLSSAPLVGPGITEQVGIREQCEWVHSDRGDATNKALWLVSGALGRLTAPLPLLDTPDTNLVFNTDIAVIGGGVSGLQSALYIAEAGLKVHLIEKTPELGGRAYKMFLDEADRELLPDISIIKENSNINILTDSAVSSVDGGLGHYILTLENGEELEAGGLVIATGSKLFDIDRIAEYRSNLPEVINSFDLNKLFEEQKEGLVIEGRSSYTPKNVHFIQCVGSRDENYNPYCSLICCTVALKQAQRIKERVPGANVYVHYMDLRGPYPGFEEKYIEAQKAGITFSRGRVAEILSDPGAGDGKPGVLLRVESIELDEIFHWPGDLVVLSVGHEPALGAPELATQLFFPPDRDSFNVEHNYHVDLKDRRGVAFVGCAQGPRFIRHSLADARRAAYELVEFFTEKIRSRDVRSIIDEERCVGCGTCVELCPYDSIVLKSVYDFEREEHKRLAVVDINTCQGCGACAAGCPSSVPTLQTYSVEQMWRQIEEMI